MIVYHTTKVALFYKCFSNKSGAGGSFPLLWPVDRAAPSSKRAGEERCSAGRGAWDSERGGRGGGKDGSAARMPSCGAWGKMIYYFASKQSSAAGGGGKRRVMDKITYTLGQGELLAIPAREADRLLRTGDGTAALVYLWLLREAGRWDAVRCAQELVHTPREVEAAAERLEKLGLIRSARRGGGDGDGPALAAGGGTARSTAPRRSAAGRRPTGFSLRWWRRPSGCWDGCSPARI